MYRPNFSGGDVVVIEEAGGYDFPQDFADEFNDYFYRQLGVQVDSVESIFFKYQALFHNFIRF